MSEVDRMSRQQRILADFGDYALGSDDLEAVLTEACRLVAEALGVDRAKVLEIQEGGHELLLRAGVGWAPGLVGTLRLTMGENSSEAYSIRAAQPVTSPDIATEDRFEFARFLIDEGIRALVNVPIFLPGRRAYGLLQVDATRPRDFTVEDTEFLRTYATILGPVIDRLHKVARLRQSQARDLRFSTIFDTAPVGLSVIGEDGRFLRVNKELAQILGRSQEDLLSVAVVDVTHEADRLKSIEGLTRCLRQGETVRLDKRYRRPAGEIVSVNSNLTPLPQMDGTMTVLVVTIDLTPRLQAERALHDSEERLRLALEAGSLATWDWNIETGKILWSEEHFRMEGFEVGEVEPSYEVWAERLHPDDKARTETALASARDEGHPYHAEFRIRLPEGEVRWMSADGLFFYDEAGAPVRMIGVQRDVTVEREWQARQAVMLSELQHRTRNLLNVVRAVADKTAANAGSLERFLPLYRERLASLSRINGLLSKLGKGERVTFDELLITELESKGVLDRGDARRVTLEGPSGVKLRSAAVQIFALAIHELATNALKYGAFAGDRGRLQVRWRVVRDETDMDHLDVEWVESEVPDMPACGAMPQGGGYGRELIERALPYQLKARTTYDLGPDGVRCTITLPLDASSP